MTTAISTSKNTTISTTGRTGGGRGRQPSAGVGRLVTGTAKSITMRLCW